MVLEIIMKMDDDTDRTKVMDNLEQWKEVKSKRKPYRSRNGKKKPM
jgi:hypothetical protein